MIGYNPSHLNKNETLLEAFHRVEAYLIEHPLYQVYQTTDNYVVDKFDYSLGNIVLQDYGKVSPGDVVLFNNVYYAVVLSVDNVKQTFNIDEGIDFRGPQGPQGPQGPKGDRGTGGAGSNPNLLINPNFAINQRGQSEYTNTKKTYTVDRTSSNRSVITPLQGGGIKLNVPSGQSNAYLQQVIENATQLVGEQLTFSANVDGVVYSHTITTVVPSENSTTPYYHKTFYFGSYHVGLELVKYKPQSNPYPVLQITWTFEQPNNTIINWWKLEIGSVATEFSPPSIAEELPKCQRYYRKYLGGVDGISLVGDFYATSTTAGFAKIYLGNMRKTPSIVISNVADIKIGFSTATFESTVVNKIQYNDITKDMSIYKAYITGTGFVAEQAYFLGIAKDGYIAFDAEI